MSKEFWGKHSIKQTPVVSKQKADSLVRVLRAGRVDVSGMSTDELHSHMTREAELVRGIRRAKGLPEVMGTRPPEPRVKLTDVATPVDNTRVVKRAPRP